jgi:hypothetical protein
VLVVDVDIHYYHGNDEADRVVVVVAAADMRTAANADDMDVGIYRYLLDYLVVVHLVQTEY